MLPSLQREGVSKAEVKVGRRARKKKKSRKGEGK
jgi:hypothetical protein